MNLKLPKQDSATGRGIKTGVQSIIGTAITLIAGLLLVINGVPGCPEAIIKFAMDNFLIIAGAIGLSSGATGFIWNVFRKGVKNY